MAIEDLEQAIPVAFDYATFRYYLQLEILQDSAKSLNWVDSNTPYRNAQPIYDAITDEVLLRMGYTHPLQVPPDEIRKMMMLGRVEAWRAVVHNTVTDVDIPYEIADSVFVNLARSGFFAEALKQWSVAQQEYDHEFPAEVQGTVQVSSPAVRTYSGAVTPRW